MATLLGVIVGVGIGAAIVLIAIGLRDAQPERPYGPPRGTPKPPPRPKSKKSPWPTWSSSSTISINSDEKNVEISGSNVKFSRNGKVVYDGPLDDAPVEVIRAVNNLKKRMKNFEGMMGEFGDMMGKFGKDMEDFGKDMRNL
jgi:hypothetical protein